MSDPEVYVSSVSLRPGHIHIPDYGYVIGPSDLTVEVQPIADGPDAEAAFRRLVGKRVRLVRLVVVEE